MKIQLFSSTGALIGTRRERQIRALVRSRQAEWIDDSSARLLHKTDEEIRASMSASQYDACAVTGDWRVIQPASTNFRVLCAQLVMPR